MTAPARRAAVAGLVALLALVLIAPAASASQMIPDADTVLKGDISRQILTTQAKDPTAVEVTSDGRVVFTERTGRVKIWHQDGRLVEAGRIGVDSKAGQCNDCAGMALDEGGLHGLLLARDFDTTGHLYLYYSVPHSLNVAPVPAKQPRARGPQSTEGKFRLSRFTLRGDTLDLASEVNLLENPAEWFYCCHYGGDMEWLPDGTLLLSVGDDTYSHESSGYAPRDYRPGKEYNNADLTSQNVADRRGKLLRIDVADVDGDGSMIPADNPFLTTKNADPYVYAMGFRSNYRFEVNPVTGTTYVGNVGPDGKYPDPTRGPAAHDELEVVPPGGGTNHGWPRCIANNISYNDYNWQTGQAGSALSCDGMTPAALYYTYQPSPTSPWVQTGTGGTCTAIMGGSIYERPAQGALRLPERFDDHLLWMEWCRGAVISTPINDDGTLDTDVEDVKVIFTGLATPADATVGPDGALYVAEYGGGLYNGANGRISRLICTGCTPASADYGGAAVVDPSAQRGMTVLGLPGAGVQTSPALALLGVSAVAVIAFARRKSLI